MDRRLDPAARGGHGLTGLLVRNPAVHHAPMKIAPFVFAALLAAQPGAAFACSIVPDPRGVEVQLDEIARDRYTRAEAMVEAIALKGSRRHHPGLVRVVRVLKGEAIRPGQKLRLRTIESSLCGAGDFERGARGLLLIGRLGGRLVFQGWVNRDTLQRLDRLGLSPIDAPALPADGH
jgi:hypothetical protein